MKFRLVESMEKASPYMLRNDGALLPCGDIHPYLLKDGENIEDIVKNGIDLDALYWFYNNTNKDSTKKNIRVLAKYFIDRLGIKDEYTLSIYGNGDVDYDFDIDEETYNLKNGELRSFINIVNDDTNQEFCRVRTSDKLWGGNSNDIYFRISSIGFNWFPIIWDFVYKNRNQIDTITICKDSSVFGGKYEPYKIGKEALDRMNLDDFITLSGNPIIEKVESKFDSINYAREEMLIGKNVSESYNWVHPIHAHSFYKKQINEQLEFDMNFLLHR